MRPIVVLSGQRPSSIRRICFCAKCLWDEVLYVTAPEGLSLAERLETEIRLSSTALDEIALQCTKKGEACYVVPRAGLQGWNGRIHRGQGRTGVTGEEREN